MSFKQNDITKRFIKAVQDIVQKGVVADQKGVVADQKEIADQLNFGKTSLSKGVYRDQIIVNSPDF